MPCHRLIAFTSIFLLIVGVNLGSEVAAVSLPTLEWMRQIGTKFGEISNGVSADEQGNTYISGVHNADAFTSKYDAVGNLIWTDLLETFERDASTGVSADRLGNVYISGRTEGNLGGTNAGGWDAFVSKYNSA